MTQMYSFQTSMDNGATWQASRRKMPLEEAAEVASEWLMVNAHNDFFPLVQLTLIVE